MQGNGTALQPIAHKPMTPATPPLTPLDARETPRSIEELCPLSRYPAAGDANVAARWRRTDGRLAQVTLGAWEAQAGLVWNRLRPGPQKPAFNHGPKLGERESSPLLGGVSLPG
jgi:hypothetical protein